MGVFDRSIAAAQRLIARYGQDCLWQKPALETEDVPGYPTIGDAPAPVPCRIAWFSPRDIGRGAEEFMALMVGIEVPSSGQVGLLAGGLDFEPNEKDSVIRDGVPVSIKKIDRLAPNGTPILYYVTITG